MLLNLYKLRIIIHYRTPIIVHNDGKIQGLLVSFKTHKI
jgi:hypothetical protein